MLSSSYIEVLLSKEGATDDIRYLDDMLWLQVDFEKRKVDHLRNRKKDTSDCLTAIANQLIHLVQLLRHVGQIEGASIAATVAAPKLGGQVTDISLTGFAPAMEEVRFCEACQLDYSGCSQSTGSHW
jgi:hypothetical protein